MTSLNKGILILTALCLFNAFESQAQCGPGCPACSGSANESMLEPNTLRGSFMSIPDGEEERAIVNLAGTVTPWLELGIGYGVDKDKIIWNAKVRLLEEQTEAWRPALVIGTGSVEIGRSDQSGYLQLFKKINLSDQVVWGLSGGFATDLPDMERGFGLANVSLEFYETMVPFYSYDGSSSHIGLTWYANDWLQFSGTYLEMEDVAITVGVTFKL